MPPESERRKEIVHHAVIGGLLAMALGVFHFLSEGLFNDIFKNYPVVLGAFRAHPIGFGITSLLIIGFIIFAVIYQLEAHWERMQTRLEQALKAQPRPIPRVGLVDGHWVDAIWDSEKRLIQGSVIKITSTTEKGFKVNGVSYYADDVENEVGDFHGEGYLAYVFSLDSITHNLLYVL
jgi:hypothetical protein